VGAGRNQLTGEMQESIIGPGGFAAFYRKAALDLVGGLSAQLGAQQADVDLALCLAKGGFTVAFEQQSRVLASRDVDLPESSFHQALYDERLFWRNLPAMRRTKRWLRTRRWLDSNCSVAFRVRDCSRRSRVGP